MEAQLGRVRATRAIRAAELEETPRASPENPRISEDWERMRFRGQGPVRVFDPSCFSAESQENQFSLIPLDST